MSMSWARPRTRAVPGDATGPEPADGPGAAGRQIPVHGPRPDADRRAAAPVHGPGRVRRPLQPASPPPGRNLRPPDCDDITVAVPEELVDHKLVALFDRAAARDFADVYVPARRFGKDALITCATQIDAGFDITVLAGMMSTLGGFSEIPVPSGLSAEEYGGSSGTQHARAPGRSRAGRAPARPARQRRHRRRCPRLLLPLFLYST